VVWSAALTEHFVAQQKFSLIDTPGNFLHCPRSQTGVTLHCTSTHVDLWRSWLYCCDIVEPWNHIPTVPCLPHTPSSAFYSVGDKSWGVRVSEWGQVRATSHWNLAPNYTDKSLHLQTHTLGNCNATYETGVHQLKFKWWHWQCLLYWSLSHCVHTATQGESIPDGGWWIKTKVNQWVGLAFPLTFISYIIVVIFTVWGGGGGRKAIGRGDAGKRLVWHKQLFILAVVSCVVHCLTDWSRLWCVCVWAWLSQIGQSMQKVWWFEHITTVLQYWTQNNMY